MPNFVFHAVLLCIAMTVLAFPKRNELRLRPRLVVPGVSTQDACLKGLYAKYNLERRIAVQDPVTGLWHDINAVDSCFSKIIDIKVMHYHISFRCCDVTQGPLDHGDVRVSDEYFIRCPTFWRPRVAQEYHLFFQRISKKHGWCEAPSKDVHWQNVPLLVRADMMDCTDEIIEPHVAMIQAYSEKTGPINRLTRFGEHWAPVKLDLFRGPNVVAHVEDRGTIDWTVEGGAHPNEYRLCATAGSADQEVHVLFRSSS